MPDGHAAAVLTAESLRQLASSVRLPENWSEQSEPMGLAPSMPGCQRRWPRIRFRSKNRLVALEMRQTLPSLPRARTWVGVYLIDMSRGGVGLFHGEPLYPKECLRIALPSGVPRLIEIVHCTRIAEHCFRIGARFVEL